MPANNVHVKGVEQTLKNMENKLGDKAITKASRQAINKAGVSVEKRLKEDMKVFKDTGASIDEVVRTNATSKATGVSARIGWNGPKQRYRLIHLNEWGYTRYGKQYHPRGFGVIEKSLKSSEGGYLRDVESELKKSL